MENLHLAALVDYSHNLQKVREKESRGLGCEVLTGPDDVVDCVDVVKDVNEKNTWEEGSGDNLSDPQKRLSNWCWFYMRR